MIQYRRDYLCCSDDKPLPLMTGLPLFPNMRSDIATPSTSKKDKDPDHTVYYYPEDFTDPNTLFAFYPHGKYSRVGILPRGSVNYGYNHPNLCEGRPGYCFGDLVWEKGQRIIRNQSGSYHNDKTIPAIALAVNFANALLALVAKDLTIAAREARQPINAVAFLYHDVFGKSQTISSANLPPFCEILKLTSMEARERLCTGWAMKMELYKPLFEEIRKKEELHLLCTKIQSEWQQFRELYVILLRYLRMHKRLDDNINKASHAATTQSHNSVVLQRNNVQKLKNLHAIRELFRAELQQPISITKHSFDFLPISDRQFNENRQKEQLNTLLGLLKSGWDENHEFYRNLMSDIETRERALQQGKSESNHKAKSERTDIRSKL